MDGMAYHLEAQRRQRVHERKRQALENLKLQKLARMVQERKEITKESTVGDIERTGTRAETRANTRTQTRTVTRTRRVREAFWVPDICQTTTGGTYRGVIPPRPEPLHQWRDLKNRVRHDYDLVPLPYKDEDIVKR